MAARVTYAGLQSFCQMKMYMYYRMLFNPNFSLWQAVSNGYWVVFEDIDKAPSDVRSVILPLLEGVNLFATGHGQVTGS